MNAQDITNAYKLEDGGLYLIEIDQHLSNEQLATMRSELDATFKPRNITIVLITKGMKVYTPTNDDLKAIMLHLDDQNIS